MKIFTLDVCTCLFMLLPVIPFLANKTYIYHSSFVLHSPLCSHSLPENEPTHADDNSF